MHIFFPIDLKYIKLKKKVVNFSPKPPPLIIINIIWGKNLYQEEGELEYVKGPSVAARLG